MSGRTVAGRPWIESARPNLSTDRGVTRVKGEDADAEEIIRICIRQ